MIRIDFPGGRRHFRPREQVAVTLEWALDSTPSRLELRLLWFTEGKGTPETAVIDRQSVPGACDRGRQAFTFLLPEAPYSFKGKLIRLAWALEADYGEPYDCPREEISISADGVEVWIGQPDA